MVCEQVKKRPLSLSAGDITTCNIRLLAYNINNFPHEVQETKLDCWQVKVGHHCIC